MTKTIEVERTRVKVAERPREAGEEAGMSKSPRAISAAVDLSNPDDVTALVTLLKVIEEKYGMPVGLIVIDTLNATAGKFDENSSRDMGQYARAARSLRNGDDRHVCILHHCGKDRTTGLRGSTAILGFIDAEFEITGGRES